MNVASQIEPKARRVSSGDWRGSRRTGALLLLAATYFVTGKLGLELAVSHPSATLVWAPAGIALAAVLVLGSWIWPGVFVAAFLVNVSATGSWWTSFFIALGNTLEPLVAAYLVNRFAGGARSFETVRDVTSYLVAAGAIGPAVAATMGATVLALGGLAEWASYPSLWLTWWAGDGVGALVVAPAILLWIYPPPMRWTRAKVLEAVAVSTATAVVSVIVFGGPPLLGAEHYPVAFVCVPFVGWAALRLSPRVSATGMVLLAAVAIWGTMQGHGPFSGRPIQEALFLLQAFVGVTAVGTLLFAATVRERRKLVQRLEELSISDPLTGLANYRHLMTSIENEIERAQRTEQPFAFILLDLDGLKSVNDQYGHLAGNQALCRLADALRSSCRAVDTAARYAGDEFALVLPDCREPEAAAVVKRIERQLARDPEPPTITVSSGLAVYPEDGDSNEELIRRADLRLYRVKEAKA